MDNAFIIVLIIAAMAGSGLMFLALRKAGQNRAALEAFAAQNNLSFAYTPGSGAAPSVSRIWDPAQDWELRIEVQSTGNTNTTGGGSVRRTTTWQTTDGALNDGFAVLGPPLPAKTLQMMNAGLGSLAGNIMKKVLFNLMRGTDVPPDSVRLIESSGGDPRGAILASAGQEGAVDGFRDAPELAAARAGRNEMMQPIVIRSAKGLQVRVRGALRTPAELTDLMDLGQALRGRL